MFKYPFQPSFPCPTSLWATIAPLSASQTLQHGSHSNTLHCAVVTVDMSWFPLELLCMSPTPAHSIRRGFSLVKGSSVSECMYAWPTVLESLSYSLEYLTLTSVVVWETMLFYYVLDVRPLEQSTLTDMNFIEIHTGCETLILLVRKKKEPATLIILVR